MDRKIKRITSLTALLCCAMTAAPAGGQIVSDASGTIDLRLNSFLSSPDLSELTTIGLSNEYRSIIGDYLQNTAGISSFDYGYQPVSPGEARFNFRAASETSSGGDGAGGLAAIDLDISVSAPFRYRFEADVIDPTPYYAVSFNGNEAYASYSLTGIYGGTFPILYYYEDGVPVYAYGWETYIDQGVLPAGEYNLSIRTFSSLTRSNTPFDTEGTASLLIQLLGDANLDGLVGAEDLNLVLAGWNQSVTPGDTYGGDLNGDGFVGVDDLNAVLGSWNADVRPPATAVSIPEPTTGCILITFALALTRRSPRQ